MNIGLTSYHYKMERALKIRMEQAATINITSMSFLV